MASCPQQLPCQAHLIESPSGRLYQVSLHCDGELFQTCRNRGEVFWSLCPAAMLLPRESTAGAGTMAQQLLKQIIHPEECCLLESNTDLNSHLTAPFP